MTKIKHFFQLVIFTIIMLGCSTEQQQVVPYVIVQIEINLDWPQFNALNSVNNAIIYPNAGYNQNGVIVYRNSIDEFTAYDATCTQHIETKTAVVLNDNGSSGQATCPQCKMVYYLSGYGSSKGFPLQRYNVTKSNNFLFIYN